MQIFLLLIFVVIKKNQFALRSITGRRSTRVFCFRNQLKWRRWIKMNERTRWRRTNEIKMNQIEDQISIKKHDFQEVCSNVKGKGTLVVPPRWEPTWRNKSFQQKRQFLFLRQSPTTLLHSVDRRKFWWSSSYLPSGSVACAWGRNKIKWKDLFALTWRASNRN